MYAVIVSGGKQYRVRDGESLKLDRMEVEPGASVEFDKVLMIVDGDNVQVGAPYLAGCMVKADVVTHGRGDKIKIIKMRRRKHHMKRMGYRSDYTEFKITGIKAA